jgi:hypothetical protein
MSDRLLALLFLLSAVAMTGCGTNFGFAQTQPEAAVAAGQADSAQADDQEAANFTAEDAKTPLVKRLLESLQEMGQEGTDEERKLIRKLLHDADDELAKSLGDNSRKKIMAANKRRRAFRLHTRDAVPDIETIRNRLQEKQPPKPAEATKDGAQQGAQPKAEGTQTPSGGNTNGN